VDLVILHGAGDQQVLRGGGLEGWGSQQHVDPVQGWGLAQLRSRDPSGAWNWHGPRGGGPGSEWIPCGARAQYGLRGRDPSG
jgi:hypothetical protein